DHPMPVVEEQAREHLVWIRGQARLEIARTELGIGQGFALAQFRVEIAPPEFERGLQAAPCDRTDRRRTRCIEQCAQAAGTGQRAAAEIDRGLAAASGTEEDRE